MGVRILEGEADGTRAAALYDSVTGVMLSPLFQGVDAAEQAVRFLGWVADKGWRSLPYNPLASQVGVDVRHWSPNTLMKLHAAWRRRWIDVESGLLRESGKEVPE